MQGRDAELEEGGKGRHSWHNAQGKGVGQEGLQREGHGKAGLYGAGSNTQDFLRYRNPVTEPSENCRDRDLRPAAAQFCRGFGDLCQICAHLPRFR